jgi:putative toxin-antitoxin system antitoxin component (TIGR02293 family)
MARTSMAKVEDSPKSKLIRPRVHLGIGGTYMLVSPMKMVTMVREGLPWNLYRGVVTELGFTDQAAAGVLHIPARTLARRKEEGRLEPQEGERLMRLVRLRTRAIEVLGTREKALRWRVAPNRALEGASPMSLLDTDIGTQAAEAVLTRVEYGVFS